MNTHRTEKGQILVLIILAIVALFGFAALAVDLGRVFSERRRAQSAADTAAFAVAFAASEGARTHVVVSDAQLQTIALNKAKDNGFVPLVGADPVNPRVQIVFTHPPSTGPYAGNNQYYQVTIKTVVEQIFSQFVFSGLQKLEVEAVARARPVQSVFPGDALHATDPSGCKAVWFAGTGDTNVTGGNIFSNSKGAGGTCASGVQNGSGGVNVNGGGIVIAGPWETIGGSGSVSPAPTTNVDQKPNPDIPNPDCSGLTDRGDFQGTGNDVVTLQPGVYSAIRITGGTITMAPGMFCLNGDFSVGGSASLTGTDVMIVMNSGSVDFLGGGTVRLSRPSNYVDASGQQWGGMLIFMPESNHGGVDIGGNNGSSYSGTIYAPGPRDSSSQKCRVSGSGSSIGLSANLVCYSVKVDGTATVVITFNEQENYRMPPIIELAQ